MIRHSSDPLSPTDWKVMKIVWQLKQCVSRDVYTRAGEQYGWSPSTVRTILSRLVDKRFLKTTQVGNCLVYSPARSFREALFGAADDLLDKTMAGKSVPLLSYLVKRCKLTPEEREELRALLDSEEREEATHGPD